MSATFPPPDATREEVTTWRRENGVIKKAEGEGGEVRHEAPAVENGPSLMCNACGLVRVSMIKPFCNGCMRTMAAAGVPIEGSPTIEDVLADIESF